MTNAVNMATPVSIAAETEPTPGVFRARPPLRFPIERNGEPAEALDDLLASSGAAEELLAMCVAVTIEMTVRSIRRWVEEHPDEPAAERLAHEQIAEVLHSAARNPAEMMAAIHAARLALPPSP